MEYPRITEALINKLKEEYPNKLPTKLISEYELGYLIGQQSVIDKLSLVYEEQEDF